MANILMMGFQMGLPAVAELENNIREIVNGIWLGEDSVITGINSWAHNCRTGAHEPYLIVQCDDRNKAFQVAQAIRSKIGIGVEVNLLQGFIEPDQNIDWSELGR